MLIIWDPRELLVSFLHFVRKPRHFLSRDFQRMSDEEKVRTAINGGSAPISGIQVIGIFPAVLSILKWNQSVGTPLIRFEDLVGEQGGSSYEAQTLTVKRICDYLEVSSDKNSIAELCGSVFDTNSPTFRSGKIGG